MGEKTWQDALVELIEAATDVLREGASLLREAREEQAQDAERARVARERVMR